MNITVGPKNLRGLLTQNGDCTLDVPSFQRGYAWGKDEVASFLDDLSLASAHKEEHFFGPLVLLRKPESSDKADIIDGQQRVTSAVMLLCLLRDEASQLEDKTLGAIPDIAFSIHEKLFIAPNLTEPKFSGNHSISNFLTQRILPFPSVARPKVTKNGAGLMPSEKRATKELRRAYLQMREWLLDQLHSDDPIRRKQQIWDLYLATTDNFSIHVMELADEDEAFVLFETLNERGLDLSPSDLLKTLILREVSASNSPANLQQALNSWDAMVANLGDYEPSRFLRHYLLTKQNGSVQATKIFRVFKERVSSHGAGTALIEISQLQIASNNYAYLLGNVPYPIAELNRLFGRLNSFSDTHRVVLLALLEKSHQPAEMARFCRLTESLAFRWILLGRNAQVLEDHYQKAASYIDDSSAGLARAFHYLEALLPGLNDVSSGIAISESAALQKYVLRRIEESTGGAMPAWDKTVNLEHLAPQNPAPDSNWFEVIATDEDADDEAVSYDDYVKNWGNLTILEEKLNKSIGNSEWQRKLLGTPESNLKGLSSSNYNINNSIKNQPKWDIKRIESRKAWLIDCVETLIGHLWIETGNSTIPMWGCMENN